MPLMVMLPLVSEVGGVRGVTNVDAVGSSTCLP